MTGLGDIPDDHTVLAAAFDAIGSDTGWQDFLDVWARRFVSNAGQLVALTNEPVSRATMAMYSRSVDSALGEHYRKHYAARDALRHLMANPGKAITATIAAGPDVSSLRAKEMLRGRDAYHEFYRPHDFEWGVGIVLTPAEASLDGMVVGLGAVRHDSAGEYEAYELSAMERFAPLVRRALQLHFRFAELEVRAAEASGAVDRVAECVVFVDGNAVVRHANPAAERILAGGDGLSIQRGRLTADRGDDRTRLHRTIFAAAGFAKAEGGPGGDLLLARPSGKRAYRVTVAPSPRREFGFGLIAAGRVVVTITDPEAVPMMPEAELRRVFGLTQGEVEIAQALARGETVAGHAERRGVSLNTARTLLKRAMAKTGSTRQSQLVAIVLGRMPQQDQDGR